MFCFSAGVILKEMEQYCPEILASMRNCLAASRKAEGKNFTQIDLAPETFDTVPDDSIDYAVMEKSANVAVVPCNIGWSDIGSWSALGDLTMADSEGNRIEGEALLHDVGHGCGYLCWKSRHFSSNPCRRRMASNFSASSTPCSTNRETRS